MLSKFADQRINVLLIGEVSAGKSTLLNSVYANTFSDMSMVRTTMTANIYSETTDATKVMSAEYIYNKNTKNEEILKNQELVEIKEELYYIKPSTNFGDVLRENNFGLNIIDVPGLNDSKNDSATYKWLDNNLKHIDVIFHIIDVTKNLSNDSNFKIVKYLADKLTSYKNIKFINVINKFDDVDDEDLIKAKEHAINMLKMLSINIPQNI